MIEFCKALMSFLGYAFKEFVDSSNDFTKGWDNSTLKFSRATAYWVTLFSGVILTAMFVVYALFTAFGVTITMTGLLSTTIIILIILFGFGCSWLITADSMIND
jgi:hypothetical protein